MRALALVLLLLAPACSDADETAVPGPEITPQAITYSDIEANQLHGAGCAYAAGTSMAPVVMAFPDEAVMKIDGEIRRFRVDAESEGSQLGDESRYLAADHVLLLTIAGRGTTNLAGTVRLIDGAGAELYAAEGTVQCNS